MPRSVCDSTGISPFLLCCLMHFVEKYVNRTAGSYSRGKRLARWETTPERGVTCATTSTWWEVVKTALESPINLKLESVQPELRKQNLQLGLGLSFTWTSRKGLCDRKLTWVIVAVLLWCQTPTQNCSREDGFSRLSPRTGAYSALRAWKDILPSAVQGWKTQPLVAGCSPPQNLSTKGITSQEAKIPPT